MLWWFRRRKIPERLTVEAAEGALLFSEANPPRADVVPVEPREGWAVLIWDYRLPAGFNCPTTHLMVLLPREYPVVPPDWFFVNRGLRDARGRSLPHYFEKNWPAALAPTLPANRGWAAGCLHVRPGTWRPHVDPFSGHRLSTYLEIIQRALAEWIQRET